MRKKNMNKKKIREVHQPFSASKSNNNDIITMHFKLLQCGENLHFYNITSWIYVAYVYIHIYVKI